MSEQKQATSPLILEYIGIDDSARPMYKDQFGKLWKDIDLGNTATPSLYSVTGCRVTVSIIWVLAREVPTLLGVTQLTNIFQK